MWFEHFFRTYHPVLRLCFSAMSECLYIFKHPKLHEYTQFYMKYVTKLHHIHHIEGESH